MIYNVYFHKGLQPCFWYIYIYIYAIGNRRREGESTSRRKRKRIWNVTTLFLSNIEISLYVSFVLPLFLRFCLCGLCDYDVSVIVRVVSLLPTLLKISIFVRNYLFIHSFLLFITRCTHSSYVALLSVFSLVLIHKITNTIYRCLFFLYSRIECLDGLDAKNVQWFLLVDHAMGLTSVS